MDKLNEQIDFYEMTEGDPELLVMLIELRRHRQDNWKQRAEAAEAQLAELAKQKPVGTVSIVRDWNTHRNVATVNMRHDLVVSEMKDGDELFTRASPAAVPVDLVPCKGFLEDTSDESVLIWQRGWNACRDEMLRRIEATSK